MIIITIIIIKIIVSPQSYDNIESLGEKWESWNKNMNGKIHSFPIGGIEKDKLKRKLF